jgi:hypothetical protein
VKPSPPEPSGKKTLKKKKNYKELTNNQQKKNCAQPTPFLAFLEFRLGLLPNDF